MEKKLDCNELYPVWTLLKDNAKSPTRIVDIPEDKIKWIENISDEYAKVQEYLSKLNEEEWKKEKDNI